MGNLIAAVAVAFASASVANLMYQKHLTRKSRKVNESKKGKFEKLCYFAHVGIGTTSDNELEKKLRSNPKLILKPLQRWQKMLIGMIQLNANNVNASLDALNRWLRDGPMLGVYFAGSQGIRG